MTFHTMPYPEWRPPPVEFDEKSRAHVHAFVESLLPKNRRPLPAPEPVAPAETEPES